MKRTVLIADDAAFTRMMLKDILTRALNMRWSEKPLTEKRLWSCNASCARI